MPRIARKNLEGNYFHIIIQGINREYIFKTNNLKDTYLKILKKNVKETKINILAYCIMDNHAHFLIYSEDVKKITKLMQKTNTSFAILYNKLNNRVGHVFRDRYYVQIILDKRQLFTCLRYIHNNPVKACIVNSPESYLYSSYLEYLNPKELITENSIKLIFGSQKEFIDILKKNHKNVNDEPDIYEPFESNENIEKFISDYMKNNNTNIKDIKKNQELLTNLLINLKYRYRMSLRKIGEIFDFSKDKVSRIINNRQNNNG